MKVCYVIPEGGVELATHGAYLLGFVRELKKYIDIYAIVEKGTGNIPDAIVQRFQWLPLHIIENFMFCLLARLRGCRYFYVHYSYTGALNAKIVTTLFGGRVSYWNCGMMWLFGKKRFLRFVLRMVDCLVTGNETMKRGYHEHLGVPLEKIKVMPNWIDQERFNVPEGERAAFLQELGIAPGEPKILFLHRLAPRKGSRHLPSLIRRVHERLPAAHFIIVGSGPDEKWLKRELQNEPNVHLLGALPNTKVPLLMAVSDIFIMPSEEEGFPRVIIEAQAAGRPYAGFDVGGTREISPPEMQQYIKDVGDVAGMSEAILNLWQMPENKKQQLSQVLKNHSTQYERENVAKRFIEIAQSV